MSEDQTGYDHNTSHEERMFAEKEMLEAMIHGMVQEASAASSSLGSPFSSAEQHQYENWFLSVALQCRTSFLGMDPIIPRLTPTLSCGNSTSESLWLNGEPAQTDRFGVSSPEHFNRAYMENDPNQAIMQIREGDSSSPKYPYVVISIDEEIPIPTVHDLTGLQAAFSESPFSTQKQIHQKNRELIHSFLAKLKYQLVICAEALEHKDFKKFQEILKKLKNETSPEGDWYQRLGYYFIQALEAKKEGSRKGSGITWPYSPSSCEIFNAHQLLFERMPYLMVPNYFACQKILEACQGQQRVHLVDFGIVYGIQWKALIRDLANRPGGPPSLRITGISYTLPQMNPNEPAKAETDSTARRLEEFARDQGVPFQYHLFEVKSNWEHISAKALSITPFEVVIVNCLFRLRHLPDDSVCPGARRRMLQNIRELKPKLIIGGEINANLNGLCLRFVDRFTATFDHSSKTFEAIDASISKDNPTRVHIEKLFFGNAIRNILACEGPERIERAECFSIWENLTSKAGFQKLPVDTSLIQELEHMMKRQSFHPDFSIRQVKGWILIGWKLQPTHAICAWKSSS